MRAFGFLARMAEIMELTWDEVTGDSGQRTEPTLELQLLVPRAMTTLFLSEERWFLI